MRVWVTKYIMRGIEEAELQTSSDKLELILVPGWYEGDRYETNWKEEGKHWHRTLESAQVKAEKMRTNQIATYQRSIERLKSMNFQGVPVE